MDSIVEGEADDRVHSQCKGTESALRDRAQLPSSSRRFEPFRDERHLAVEAELQPPGRGRPYLGAQLETCPVVSEAGPHRRLQVHPQLHEIGDSEMRLERGVEDPMGRCLALRRRLAPAGKHRVEVRLETDLARRRRLRVVDLDLEGILRAGCRNHSCRGEQGKQEGAHGRDGMRPRHSRRARVTFRPWPTRWRSPRSARSREPG